MGLFLRGMRVVHCRGAGNGCQSCEHLFACSSDTCLPRLARPMLAHVQPRRAGSALLAHSGSRVLDLPAHACSCVWNGETKGLVDVANPRRARETAEAQAFIDRDADGKLNDTRGQSKTVDPIWARNPEGRRVAMHDCQVVFVSYETLRRELGRARWAWLLHLREPHAMRQIVVQLALKASQGLQAGLPAFSGSTLVASQTLAKGHSAAQHSLSWASQHSLCSPACDVPCRSKLLQFGFWRVMLDEAQLVAASSSAAAVMCSSLWRRHAWVVTGTPVTRKAEEVQVSCC